MSRQDTAKSVTTKGSPGRCGGGRGKVIVLIRGGLSEGPEMPVQCVRRVEVDHGDGNVRVQRREVSRGHSTGGDERRAGKGRTHEPEGHSSCSLGRDDEGSHPRNRVLGGWG